MAMTTSPLKLFFCICIYFYLTLNLFYFMAFDDILHGFSIYCWTQTLVMFFYGKWLNWYWFCRLWRLPTQISRITRITLYQPPGCLSNSSDYYKIIPLQVGASWRGLFCCSETHPPPNFMSFTTYLMLVVHIVN